MNLRLIKGRDDAAALKALDYLEEVLDRFERSLDAGCARDIVRARLDLADWGEVGMSFPKTENARLNTIQRRTDALVLRWKAEKWVEQW